VVRIHSGASVSFGHTDFGVAVLFHQRSTPVAPCAAELTSFAEGSLVNAELRRPTSLRRRTSLCYSPMFTIKALGV
jgi:hypothetical protein